MKERATKIRLLIPYIQDLLKITAFFCVSLAT